MDKSKDLCGSCGMCCDGTLFPSFRIYAEEMDLFNTMSNTIPQSCEHFEGCNGCKIYNKRPFTCQQYKCSVLRAFEDGKLSYEESLEFINPLKNDKNNKELRSDFISGRVIEHITKP